VTAVVTGVMIGATSIAAMVVVMVATAGAATVA
jgi:hypothetical protein